MKDELTHDANLLIEEVGGTRASMMTGLLTPKPTQFLSALSVSSGYVFDSHVDKDILLHLHEKIKQALGKVCIENNKSYLKKYTLNSFREDLRI